QPGLGIARAALLRPLPERRGECFRQRVLCLRNVAGGGCQECDELAVAAARDGFCRAARRIMIAAFSSTLHAPDCRATPCVALDPSQTRSSNDISSILMSQ